MPPWAGSVASALVLRLLTRRWKIGLVVLAAASLTVGCANESPRLDGDERLIARYCEYGAVSQAQLDGCLDHVTAGRIQQLETPTPLLA